MQRLFTILGVSAFLAFCSTLSAETFYSFTFEADSRHKVEVELPDGWSNVEGERKPLYDLKFIDESGDQESMIFIGAFETEGLTQEDIVEAADEIKKAYYGKKPVYNHQMSFSSTSCFHGFEVADGASSYSVGIATFPIKNYLFGVAVKNLSPDANPSEECNFFIQKIKLYIQE